MTLSLLMNNGQLALPKGGRLPQTTDCCCDLSPPTPCLECSNGCTYFIEITSPQSFRVKTDPTVCLDGWLQGTKKGSTLFGVEPTWVAALPVTVLPPNRQPFWARSFEVSNSLPVFGFPPTTTLHGSAYEWWSGNLVEFNADPRGAEISVFTKAFVNVSCDPLDDFLGVILFFDGSVHVEVDPGADGSTTGTASFWVYNFRSTVSLPLTECVDINQKHCSNWSVSGNPNSGVPSPIDSNWLGRFIATPLTFTVDKNGCSLGGNFTSELLEDGSPPPSPENPGTMMARAVGQAVRDAFSYTFKITSRPSCREVPAACDVPIGNGDMSFAITTNPALPVGDPENDRFILGTATVHQGSGPNDTTIRIEHMGAAIGDAGDPYFFLYQLKNQAGDILHEMYIDVFCAEDNAVSPPVSRWYVRVGIVCVTDYFSQTYDEWIGTIPSYESPGTYIGINIGDPVPLGSANLVHNDDYPVSTGTPCEPPTPPEFALSLGSG